MVVVSGPIREGLASDLPINSLGNKWSSIQDAVDDVGADGWVYVPPGTHIIATPLQLDDSNFRLWGGGLSSVISVTTDSINAIEVGNAVERLSIENLKIVFGGGLTDPRNGIVFEAAGSGSTPYNCLLQHLWIDNVGADYYGVEVNGGLYIPMNDVTVMDGGGLIKLDTAHAGHKPLNADLRNLRLIVKKEDSTHGIDIVGTHTKLNLVDVNAYTIFDGGSHGAGKAHIHLDNCEFINFRGGSYEHGEYFVIAENTPKVINFDGVFFYTSEVNKYIDINPASGVTFQNSWLGAAEIDSAVASNVAEHCTEYTVKGGGTLTEHDKW